MLTPSQTKALSTERHLAITANAGSGKTRVLVERYVNLFETRGNLSARNVVAITFTENAGAELRTRILEEIKGRLQKTPRTDREKRPRLIAIRDSLPSAFIGTIHGFASRLLRAYPVESNVDASFNILTGADQRIFLEEALTRVFYSALEEAYAATEETSVLYLFRALGRKCVTGLIHALLRNPSRTEQVRQMLLEKSDEDIISFWNDELVRTLAFITSDSTRELLRELLSCVKKGKLGQEAIPYFTMHFGAEGSFETIRTFAALAQTIVTGKGTIHLQRFDLDTLSSEAAEHVPVFLARYDSVKSLLDTWPSTPEQYERNLEEYLLLLRSVFDLHDRVRLEYESSKQSAAQLDFNDLIVKLQRLLDDPRVLAELSEQFQFIMIDEYQDTDESQFELARKLTRNFSRQNNLTVVGDPKQSIYTFRNADASVFQKTENAIRSQPLSELALEESRALGLSLKEERGDILLSESFRMASAPLAAINILFRNTMSASTPGPFVATSSDYSDLVLGRTALTNGTVEWICPAKTTEEEAEEESGEAELIAQKILQITQGNDSTYHVQRKEELDGPAFEDIAILIRSRTNLPSIEAALRARSIPYAIAKGAGFYSQQEILDISSYLTFLVTPSSDIALASILRSPFFALSDVDLFQIGHYGATHRPASNEAWSLWNKFQSYTEAARKPHLVRTLEQLRSHHALAGRTGAAQLVENIFAETGIVATLAAGPNGAQKIANLDKYLAHARASDTSGFSSLFDFVDRIKYLIEEEEQESQADFTSEVRGVRIMTVHSAKGLEFPIVIIPFLQKKFKFDLRETLDKELGLQITIPDSDNPLLISELIRLRARASTVSEEKRVFYVAATRARDHLVFSSTLPKHPPRDTWLEWMDQALPGAFDVRTSRIEIEERISIYNSDTRGVSEKLVRFEIPLIRSKSDISFISEEKASEDSNVALGTLHLDPVPAHRTISRFSASQLLRFKECPTKYYLSYILGMPEEAKLLLEPDDEDASEIVRGDILGQIVHKLMDKIDTLAPGGQLDRERFESHLDHTFFDMRILDEVDRSRYSSIVRDHVQRFLGSELAARVFAGNDMHTEFSLQAPLETGDMLFGIIDRLYRDTNGVWTILDYKTERGTARHEQNRTRHEFQLRFYAYLIHLLYPEAPSIHAILFYTETGEGSEYEFDTANFSEFKTEVLEIIEAVRASELASDLFDLYRNMSHCPECRFFDDNRKQCIVLNAHNLEPNRNTREIPELA